MLDLSTSRIELSHAEEHPGLIEACSDLHSPQIKMYLKLAKGVTLLHLNLLNPAENPVTRT